MKRFILVVSMIGVLCSCGFAEVVSFESIKTKMDVLDWTYEENKEDASVVLQSPEKDCAITFKRMNVADGTSAEDAAVRMMKDDNGHTLDKMGESAYSYKYGKDSEAYVHADGGELFVIKVDGFHKDAEKILRYIPKI